MVVTMQRDTLGPSSSPPNRPPPAPPSRVSTRNHIPYHCLQAMAMFFVSISPGIKEQVQPKIDSLQNVFGIAAGVPIAAGVRGPVGLTGDAGKPGIVTRNITLTPHENDNAVTAAKLFAELFMQLKGVPLGPGDTVNGVHLSERIIRTFEPKVNVDGAASPEGDAARSDAMRAYQACIGFMDFGNGPAPWILNQGR